MLTELRAALAAAEEKARAVAPAILDDILNLQAKAEPVITAAEGADTPASAPIVAMAQRGIGAVLAEGLQPILGEAAGPVAYWLVEEGISGLAKRLAPPADAAPTPPAPDAA